MDYYLGRLKRGFRKNYQKAIVLLLIVSIFQVIPMPWPEINSSGNWDLKVKEVEGASADEEYQPKVISTGTYKMTAYTSEVAQTDSTPCITANGYNVCKSGVEDTIAANFLEFGTKVRIPELYGDRVFIVRDRMNRRYTNRVDIWMKDKHDAIHFGVQVAKIEVLE
jgi:3D (Asp-Asp-Asp) domain-containing protein